MCTWRSSPLLPLASQPAAVAAAAVAAAAAAESAAGDAIAPAASYSTPVTGDRHRGEGEEGGGGREGGGNMRRRSHNTLCINLNNTTVFQQ